jgi:hypothetical protein
LSDSNEGRIEEDVEEEEEKENDVDSKTHSF